MKVLSPREIKELLQKHRIFPSKGLGQNFLVSKVALNQLVGSAELKREDVVLEIGPGVGVLTLELAKRVKKVIAVEKDRGILGALRDILKEVDNVEIVQGDILKFNPEVYKLKTYKIVANLPYYIATPAIRKFLESEVSPKLMVLMVQKEVGQRIVARPPKMNLLAVSVQFYAKPEIISFVSKKAFWPQPKVDGAIFKITPNYFLRKTNDRRFFVRRENRNLFFKIVRSGFSQPRKQLINNLSKGLKLNKLDVESLLRSCDIKPDQRAEALDVSDWILLTKKFAIIKA